MSSSIRRLISPTCATSVASIARSQLRIRSRTPSSAQRPWVCYQCRTFAQTLARRKEDGRNGLDTSDATKESVGDDAAAGEAKELTTDEVSGLAKQDLTISAEEVRNSSIIPGLHHSADSAVRGSPTVELSASKIEVEPQLDEAQAARLQSRGDDKSNLLEAVDSTITKPSPEVHEPVARESRLTEDIAREQILEKAEDASGPSAEAVPKDESVNVKARTEDRSTDAQVEPAKNVEPMEELSLEQSQKREQDVQKPAAAPVNGDGEVAIVIDQSHSASKTAAPKSPSVDNGSGAGNVSKLLPSVYDDPTLPTTILSHGESEARRDLREYARLAAWELPLLHKLAKSFTPPDINKTPLRFRYTSYQGEQHPAARKVVVEFSPYDLSTLSDAQRLKLIKLAGVRYDPSTRIIKISCESFETVAQNKRYVGDLVNKLVKEAQNPSDMFEDIPVDVRHYRPKARYEFPEEWKIQWKTEGWSEDGEWIPGDRIVGSEREQKMRQELQDLHEKGKFVDGRRVIEQLQKQRSLLPVPTGNQRTGEKVRVFAGSGGKRKPPGRMR